MRLQVGLDVDPGVFDAHSLPGVGAEIIQYHHMGWLSVHVDAERMEELTALPGVESFAPVLSCADQLDTLVPSPEWTELVAAEFEGLLRGRLEAGRSGGRVCVLRQTIEVEAKCFVRSHRTDGQDIVVGTRDAAGGWRPVCRQSDGLRDRSLAGMHDWLPGQSRVVAMWVGHLPAGEYIVRGGIDGLVRVTSHLVPFLYESPLVLGSPASVAQAVRA